MEGKVKKMSNAETIQYLREMDPGDEVVLTFKPQSNKKITLKRIK